VFVAGEAETDEPLSVKQTRRLLQQGNPTAVVLNQVVVGGEDGSDFVLDWARWDWHFNQCEFFTRKVLDRRASEKWR